MLALGGARLPVPAGWVARRMKTGVMPEWCLEAASKPLPYLPGDCPLQFSQIPAAGALTPISADIEGGLLSNPEFCAPGQLKSDQLLGYADARFGGRAADYRQWKIVCKSGHVYQIEQYVIATRPGYIVFSQNAGAAIHSLINQLAAGATLPAANAALRYCDLGIVRTLSHQSGGYHLTLDRVIQAPHAVINNNPATYPYLVPDAAVQNNGHRLAVGSTVIIATNGVRVTELSVTQLLP